MYHTGLGPNWPSSQFRISRTEDQPRRQCSNCRPIGSEKHVTTVGRSGCAGSGDILFNGETFSGLTEDQRASIRRGRIGFVFQSFQLLQGLTAMENVMLPLELMGLSVNESKKRSTGWLDRVGLEARIHHRPRMLSGGEQQRVAVARHLLTNPLFFADEPTGNLDRKTGESITELLFKLNRETGTTLILVTHDERLADQCRRVLHLEDGQLNEVAA